MNVEILEFYPIERDEDKGFLSGTLRIRLSTLGIDILGIYALKNKNGWYFRLPNGKSIHQETGAPCWYPFLSFYDKEKQKQLMQEIKEKGTNFIENRLADKENTLIFHGKPSFSKRQASPPKTKEAAKEAKETADSARLRPASSTSGKVWVDPPPRKKITTAVQKSRSGRMF